MENYKILDEKEFKTLKSAFKFWQKSHPNFITPDVLRVETVRDFIIIEISTGKGIITPVLYGVSAFVYDKLGHTFNNIDKVYTAKFEGFIKCVSTLQEAEILVKSFKEAINTLFMA